MCKELEKLEDEFIMVRNEITMIWLKRPTVTGLPRAKTTEQLERVEAMILCKIMSHQVQCQDCSN
jgi:hypothetical protein